MKNVIPLLAAVCLGVVQSASSAEKTKRDPSILTVDRIYASEEFKLKPYSARWLKDGSGFTTLEPSKDPAGGRDIVRYHPRTGKREVMVPAAHLVPSGETAPLKIDDYSWSADYARLLVYTNSKRVWRRKTRGDYWVLDRTSRELRQLGGDARPSTLMFAKFSPAGDQVAYVREKNLYLEDVREGRIVALTRTESDMIINGTFDWVYEEELGLRDGFVWSPDGKSIAYWQINTEGVRRFPLVNQTDALYPRIQWIEYPKAGEKNSACRVGVVNVEDRKTKWLNVPGDPRNHYIVRMEWAANSKEVLLQQLNRLQNTNRVMLANARSGEVTTILTERDQAWVNVHDELTWLSGGKRFTWISERDGWRHVYLVSRSGGTPELVTPGEYDVIELLHVDEVEGWLYFIASPENATQRYLYRSRLDGTGRQRLTPSDQPGTHSYVISPDIRFAIHTYSTFGQPPTTDLIRLPDHKTIRALSENKQLRQRVAKLKQGPREFFSVTSEPGVTLDAWCINPPDFDAKKKYPLLVYVYGEPAGQTVLDRWGRHYLWHLMMSQRGYLVMSFDNRGTPAPRGREWRKVIYRQVGVLAPKDQAAALRAVLKERPYIDQKRIGIWGWSGGGSMSLNAIFKYTDLYQMAVSVAPVSNQRYYDTIYQERYMGLPSDNVKGFRDGSPIHFAHRLKGNLLVIHGTADDNVHYQSTVALANELIRHNKHFTMMAYPNRTHSIREGVNTSRHLRALMTRYFLEHLKPGARRRKPSPPRN